MPACLLELQQSAADAAVDPSGNTSGQSKSVSPSTQSCRQLPLQELAVLEPGHEDIDTDRLLFAMPILSSTGDWIQPLQSSQMVCTAMQEVQSQGLPL